MIKINEEERNIIVKVMLRKFEEFKVNNSWGLTEQMEDNYKEGMIDILDSMITAFGGQQSIYDIATLRNILEEHMSGVDEEQSEL